MLYLMHVATAKARLCLNCFMIRFLVKADCFIYYGIFVALSQVRVYNYTDMWMYICIHSTYRMVMVIYGCLIGMCLKMSIIFIRFVISNICKIEPFYDNSFTSFILVYLCAYITTRLPMNLITVAHSLCSTYCKLWASILHCWWRWWISRTFTDS